MADTNFIIKLIPQTDDAAFKKQAEKLKRDMDKRISKELGGLQKKEKERFTAEQKQLKIKEKDRKEEKRHQEKLFANQNRQFKKEQAEYKRFVANANNFKLMSNYPGQKPGMLSRADQWLHKNRSPVTLSGMRGAAGFLGRVGGSILGGLGGFLVGGAQAGYEKYKEYGSALGGAIGYGRNSGASTKASIGAARGGRLGYSLIDTANQVGSMARNTGVTGPRELQQGMRATGLDQGELGSIYGTIRQAGVSFEGSKQGQGATKANSPGGKEFQKMISLGMASGLERGRLPEFFQGVTQLVSEQGSRSAGDIDVTTFSKQLAMLGKGGSGFQGARGAAVLSKIAGGIVNPGGGEYGQTFMRQAMGFGKPGGDVTYYNAEKMREQGIKDPKNISRVIDETVAQHGAGEEGALHLRELLGVSLEQAEGLFKIRESSKSAEEQLEDMQKIADESKSLEEQSLEQMKGLGGVVRRLAGRTDIMIGVGARAADAIEQVEDWQTKLLFWLIKMAENIADIVVLIKGWMESSQPGQKAKEAINAVNSKYQSARFVTDPDQQDAALRNYIADMRVQKELAMKGGASMKNQFMGQEEDFGEAARSSTLGEAQARAVSALSAKYANAYGVAPDKDALAKIRRIANTDPNLQAVANAAGMATKLGVPEEVNKAVTEGKTVDALNRLTRAIEAADLKAPPPIHLKQPEPGASGVTVKGGPPKKRKVQPITVGGN